VGEFGWPINAAMYQVQQQYYFHSWKFYFFASGNQYLVCLGHTSYRNGTMTYHSWNFWWIAVDLEASLPILDKLLVVERPAPAVLVIEWGSRRLALEWRERGVRPV
jgi:hypothetical protein